MSEREREIERVSLSRHLVWLHSSQYAYVCVYIICECIKYRVEWVLVCRFNHISADASTRYCSWLFIFSPVLRTHLFENFVSRSKYGTVISLRQLHYCHAPPIFILTVQVPCFVCAIFTSFGGPYALYCIRVLANR